jgi:hypothetical protein
MLLSPVYSELLFAAACTYLARGWSVIPVYGEGQPDRAKVAAVEWSPFQHRRGSAHEVSRWFTVTGYGGLAVVTGRISSLAVLDFDDLNRFDQFQTDYPDLVETYTVQTRRGLHLYFHVRPGVRVESGKAPKVDLQFEGRYVVAPPTVIGDCRYRVVRDLAPKTISDGDIQRLYAFLAAIHRENAPAPVFAASEGVSEGNCVEKLTAAELVALYRHLAARLGRNEALFRVSLRARDEGWLLEQVMSCLAHTHTHQPATDVHHAETPAQRHREATGTIESAFSRPPRLRPTKAGQLPNSLREALLQLGQTHTLRVLEGLRLRGVQQGQVFTYRQAVQLLSGLVGQWSIDRALAALAPDGTFIFAPLPRTHPHANADSEVPEPLSKKRLMIRASTPRINRRGRPTRRYFTMPGAFELCERLGVRPSGSDTVTEADVGSANGYRQALHRAYIQRCPGQYPRSWLAQRLGVSVRTEQRYNLAADIHVQARYDSVIVSWSNLNAIADFEVAGTFLQDERGKRYPARQEIAAHLLAQRHTVVYKRQQTNHYSCGEPPPGLTLKPSSLNPGFRARTKAPKKTKPIVILDDHPVAVNVLTAAPDPPVSAPLVQPVLSSSTPALPQRRTGLPVRVEHRSKRFYRKPLADSRMEYLAEQVHAETTKGMSLANARRLLDTYGVPPVGKALKRMVWLRQKGNIRNPAGFLVVASRIAWRIQNGASELGRAAPCFRGEPARNVIKRD